MQTESNATGNETYDKLKQRLSSISKEKETLGHILNIPNDQVELFTELKPAYFSDINCRELFEIMAGLFQSKHDITYSVVHEFIGLKAKNEVRIDQLRRTLEEVKSYVLSDTVFNTVSLLRELLKNRQIYSEILVKGEMMFSQNEPISKIMDHMSQVLVKVETGRQEKQVKDVASSVVHAILNPLEVEKGLDTGLIDIDLQFGGIKKDTYYTIGALSGAGKTAFVCDMIERLCTRHKDKVAILFFSLEMAEERIVKRLVSRITRLTNQTLDLGALNKEERELVAMAGARIAEYPLEIVYATMGITDMTLRVRKFALENPDKHLVVMLDHMDLVTGSTTDMRVNKIMASTMCKSWCRDYKASVMALTQFTKEADHPNRKKEYYRPNMAYIMESGRVRQDSDAVWLLWRPETHFQHIPYMGVEQWPTKNKLIILNEKNRDGQSPTDMIFNCNIGCNYIYNLHDVF